MSIKYLNTYQNNGKRLKVSLFTKKSSVFPLPTADFNIVRELSVDPTFISYVITS